MGVAFLSLCADMQHYTKITGGKFPGGQCLTTQGVAHSFSLGEVFCMLERHFRGDWGDLSEPDRLSNESALHDGSRLLSSYKWPDGRIAWVITEAEDSHGVRACTTVLLPDEY